MLVLQACKSDEYRNSLEIKRQQVITSLGKTASTTKSEDIFLPLPKTDTLSPKDHYVQPKKTKLKTRSDPNAPPELAIDSQDEHASLIKTTITVPK